MPPDCYGCRAAQARFCCACVQQAVTERHALERAAHAEKAKLEHAMADGIAARTRLLSQREARRAHRQLMADLSGELFRIHRESSRLADDVNGLLHAVQSSRTRLSEQPQAPPRAPTPAATAETTAAAAKGLTSARAALIHELLTLQDDVWCDVSVDEQLDEQLLRLKATAIPASSARSTAEELLLLRDTLRELLTAPSLAWEVDAAQCALWTGEADEELHEAGLWARSGERDEWDLVQPPEVPTPSQGEEIARWEAAMLAENVRGGASAAGVRSS
ncbi:hypothetical protein Ctob_010897 [Chrysochromulina tobinii]|uniref:Uncharacterized protein n=1 Tax=Chrysochromulina tobinii TaxID=1460289 RepID=A0A0M0LSQ6_9EUKA|nr:hypothetical protein Ctob_010897 [Chrysochromulina tobinii]|eukprot:KOO53788.1 hypothetical protein Ctob_010897 [Chrysochromulina sp. CCMP291]